MLSQNILFQIVLQDPKIMPRLEGSLGRFTGLGIQLCSLQQKDTNQHQQREQVHGAKFSVESHRTHLNPSATTCDNTHEMLSTRKPHQTLSIQGFTKVLAKHFQMFLVLPSILFANMKEDFGPCLIPMFTRPRKKHIEM